MRRGDQARVDNLARLRGTGESVMVELSWAAPAQPVPVDFFVQVLALNRSGTHPAFASYLKR
jgi:hypothetical protein